MDNNNDILLTDDFDDAVVNGDFDMGDGTEDDCLIITKLNKGALKSDVILGPNLVMMMNGKVQQRLLL